MLWSILSVVAKGGESMAHILIVEDEEAVRFLVRRILQSAGHSVDEARTGAEALRMIDESEAPIDLIILDLWMPNMNGFEFLDDLKLRPFYPPVILLTADDASAKRRLNQHEAISGQIIKPFDRKAMLDMIHRVLSASAG